MSGSNDVIAANYIGTDPTGTSAVGNGRQGVLVNGSNNTIGGSTAGSRECHRRERQRRVADRRAGATGNVVAGERHRLEAATAPRRIRTDDSASS